MRTVPSTQFSRVRVDTLCPILKTRVIASSCLCQELSTAEKLRLMRGPAGVFCLGTQCCQSRWQRPCMTMTSPPAGVKAVLEPRGEADEAAGERRLGQGPLVADLHAIGQDEASQTLPLL